MPRAKRDQKPVYINNDLFGGSYRRDWEGDYHCLKAEVKALSLAFTEKQADKTSEQNKRTKQANRTSEQSKRRKTEENYSLIKKYLAENGLSKTGDIARYIGLSTARTRAILGEMQGITYEGTTNNRKYKLEEKH